MGYIIAFIPVESTLRYLQEYSKMNLLKKQLKVGQLAPNFTLPSHLDQPFTLEEYRGRVVVLAFFPMAFTPI